MMLIGAPLFFLFGTVACLFAVLCIASDHPETRKTIGVGLLAALLLALVPVVVAAAEINEPCDVERFKRIYGECCWWLPWTIQGCIFGG